MVAASHLGLAMVRSGDLAGGLAKLQATHSQVETMGFRGQLAFCLASLAEGYLLAGDLTAAQNAAELASGEHHDAGARAQALLVLAECLRLQSADEAAEIAERLLLRPLARRCRQRMGSAV